MSRLWVFLLTCSILLGVPFIAAAQSTMTTTSGMGNGTSSNARLQAELANEKKDRKAERDAALDCQNAGKIYAPNHPQKDANGCIPNLVIDHSGNVVASGAVSAGAGLEVTGASTITGALNVTSGKITADTGMEVTGTSTISGQLKVTNGNIETAGTIKIGGDSATCAGVDDKGSLRYNSGTNKVEFCDGNSWAEFGVGGAGAGSTGAQCDSPLGVDKIDHGASIIAFQATHVPYGTTCGMQVRTCLDGTLSGSYTAGSCSVDPPLDCNNPWGGIIPHGGSIVAYQATSVACHTSCASQTRVCNNGTLSGNYAYQSCVPACASCNLPWGGSIAHGNSVTAYAAPSVGCGGSCSGQTRICDNGTLSNSYTYASCSVGGCAGCSVNGYYVPHGGCATFYGASCCGCCSSQTRCCNNGSISGSSAYNATGCPWCDPCFAAGAMVTMADGSVKKIQLVKAGDLVRGKDGSVNKVVRLIHHETLPTGKLYMINKLDFRVTNNHPMLTTDGWKTIKGGEIHGIQTKPLKVGDVLIKIDGSTETVTDIIGYPVDHETRTYDLSVDGNHTYVVDGVIVHNKSA